MAEANEPKGSKAEKKNGKFFNVDEFKRPGAYAVAKFLTYDNNNIGLPSNQKDFAKTLPVYTPDEKQLKDPPRDALQVTWLGHACVLVQFEGINILTDPVFSERCGPTSYTGYKRYRPAPLQVSGLPVITAVLISHNHYDHLDVKTVEELNELFGSSLSWYVPKGVKDWMVARGIPMKKVTEMDWWQEEKLRLEPQVDVCFTPAQHWSRRGVFDECKTLWGSWCVIGRQKRFYFAGDTGYSSHVFKDIGDHCGPFDLAAIPIGAYEPREFMKNQHVNPEEAVRIHCDVRAKKSVGVHWGTFPLSYEPYMEPPNEVIKAMDKFRRDPKASGLREDSKLNSDDFFTLKHGEIRVIEDDTPKDNGTADGHHKISGDSDTTNKVSSSPDGATLDVKGVGDTQTDPRSPNGETSIDGIADEKPKVDSSSNAHETEVVSNPDEEPVAPNIADDNGRDNVVDSKNEVSSDSDGTSKVSSSPDGATHDVTGVVDTQSDRRSPNGETRVVGIGDDKPRVASSSDAPETKVDSTSDEKPLAPNIADDNGRDSDTVDSKGKVSSDSDGTSKVSSSPDETTQGINSVADTTKDPENSVDEAEADVKPDENA